MFNSKIVERCLLMFPKPGAGRNELCEGEVGYVRCRTQSGHQAGCRRSQLLAPKRTSNSDCRRGLLLTQNGLFVRVGDAQSNAIC
jgi:hypothetical protein